MGLFRSILPEYKHDSLLSLHTNHVIINRTIHSIINNRYNSDQVTDMFNDFFSKHSRPCESYLRSLMRGYKFVERDISIHLRQTIGMMDKKLNTLSHKVSENESNMSQLQSRLIHDKYECTQGLKRVGED